MMLGVLVICLAPRQQRIWIRLCSMLCLVFPDDHLRACVFGVRCVGNQFEIVLHAIGSVCVVFQLSTNKRQIEPALRPSIECCQPASVMLNSALKVLLLDSILRQYAFPGRTFRQWRPRAYGAPCYCALPKLIEIFVSQYTAWFSSLGTPFTPCLYRSTRAFCAGALPCSAALRYQKTAWE